MGRVNRRANALPGSCFYEIHISFSSYLSMFCRCMRNTDLMERRLILDSMDEVLRLLVTPTDCYHTLLENHFEVDPDPNKVPCGLYCSACNGEVEEFTGLFYRRKLRTLLTKHVLSSKVPMTCGVFIKLLKEKKKDYFHKKGIPGKQMGPIHALALQMVANKIIEVYVPPQHSSKVSTTGLLDKHLCVRLTNGIVPSEDGSYESDGSEGVNQLPAYVIE